MRPFPSTNDFVSQLFACSSKSQRIETPIGGRRASVAVLLAPTTTGTESQWHVLLIKRAANERDPWSGDVALPGGKQDEIDAYDDEATAIREVVEEVGINCRNWKRLGRIADDRLVRRGQSRKIIVSTWGFQLERSLATLPKTTIQTSEVAFAWWVPLSHLCPENLEMRRIPMPLSSFPPVLRPLLKVVGATDIGFASLPLPLPPSAPPDIQVPLWGLTLSLISDVLRRGAAKPLVGSGGPVACRDRYGIAGYTLADKVVRAALALRGHEKTVRRTLCALAGVALLGLAAWAQKMVL